MSGSSGSLGPSVRKFQRIVDRLISEGRCAPEERHRCGDCMDEGLRYRIVRKAGRLPAREVARCHCKASLRWSEQITAAEQLDTEAMFGGGGRIKWYTKYSIGEAMAEATEEARATMPPQEGDLG
jgi:hypothetical protein